MSLKFYAADFDVADLVWCKPQEIANLANAVFDAWLKEQPVVYSCPGHGLNHWHKQIDTHQDTHTARLVCIEPIEKKPEPKLIRECPRCKSKNISTERRPNGDSKCGDCNFSGSTMYFDRYEVPV